MVRLIKLNESVTKSDAFTGANRGKSRKIPSANGPPVPETALPEAVERFHSPGSYAVDQLAHPQGQLKLALARPRPFENQSTAAPLFAYRVNRRRPRLARMIVNHRVSEIPLS